VVSLARLLGGDDAPGARWVAVRAPGGTRALEVDEVLGFRDLCAEELGSAPPLLGRALQAHAEALAVLDGHLVAVLDAARLLDAEPRP
jgi:chemotaxis signal transduction protein